MASKIYIMASKVFYIDMYAEDSDDRIYNKIQRLFDAAELGTTIKKGDLTAIKLHFGEWGNTTFIPPWNIRAIVEKVRENGGKPYLTDTNTLYRGMRRNAIDHLETAIRHGFTKAVVDAPLIIADGLTGLNEVEVEINQKHFQKVKLARGIVQADSILISSHFKGHLMAGFGGAIKNMAMGSATPSGKKEQHSVRPQLGDFEKCTGCGTCFKHCPVDAIEIIEGKAYFDSVKCIGCGECVARCPEEAVKLNWETEIPDFTERMVEYAYGLWVIHKEKMGYINFVIDVTPECDCFDISQRTIVSDIGILASRDPVALDKACYDLVNDNIGKKDSILKVGHQPGEDKFTGLHKETRGDLQFSYAEQLGMGSTEYELINLSKKPKTQSQ